MSIGRGKKNLILALGATEIATGVLVVSLQGYACGLVAPEEELDVVYVHRAVAVLVFHMVEDDGERLWLLALAIPLVVFGEQGALAGDGGTVVAGGDELFEAKLVEVGGEVLEEVALEGVVAVAVDDLAAEGVGVELKVSLDLFLDVDVLGVELVLFGRLRGACIHGEKDNNGYQMTYFIIGKHNNEFTIFSGNIVNNTVAEKLNKRLNSIKSLGDSDLKRQYMDVLSNGELSSKGGAGLGFLTIALKSNNNIDFDFEMLNKEYSLFSLQSKVLG